MLTTLRFSEDARRTSSETPKHCGYISDGIEDVGVRANLCRVFFRRNTKQTEVDISRLGLSFACENVYRAPSGAANPPTLIECVFRIVFRWHDVIDDTTRREPSKPTFGIGTLVGKSWSFLPTTDKTISASEKARYFY
ncbi:hypothetical protein [Bradyrhizobium sp. BR 1432]|uniref:hypothetical protein n=1 Tax=Bradyrhizobium sp. BR 1432 TaxID=3447966 RepID=UPI003EE6E6B8